MRSRALGCNQARLDKQVERLARLTERTGGDYPAAPCSDVLPGLQEDAAERWLR